MLNSPINRQTLNSPTHTRNESQNKMDHFFSFCHLRLCSHSSIELTLNNFSNIIPIIFQYHLSSSYIVNANIQKSTLSGSHEFHPPEEKERKKKQSKTRFIFCLLLLFCRNLSYIVFLNIVFSPPLLENISHPLLPKMSN